MLAAQAAFTLAQLLSQRLAWLSEVLAAIEHDAGLARLGLTEAVLSVMLGAALEPVLQARHSTGPSGLQSLDLEATECYAWLNYIKKRAYSKTPITQVQHWLAPRRTLHCWCKAESEDPGHQQGPMMP